MNSFVKTVASGSIAAVFLWSCGGGNSNENGGIIGLQQRILSSAAEGVIVPGYANLKNQSGAFQNQVDSFCIEAPGNRTENELDALKESWKAVMDDWMRLQVIRFGPVTENNRQFSMQFWPDPGNKVGVAAEQLVAGSLELDETLISGSTTQSQGLPILEYLLFAGNSGNPLTDFNSSDGQRRCELLSAVATYQHNLAATIHNTWVDSYATELSHPGGASYTTQEEAIEELINSMVEFLEIIKGNKLGDPLGTSTPNPQAAESYRSENSINNIINNLLGLRDLYRGDENDGFDDYLKNSLETKTLDTQMEDLIQQSISAAETISLPLTDAVSDANQKALVQALELQISMLISFIKNDFASAMNANIGFNANDGD